MAQFQQPTTRKKGQRVQHSLRVDMTPMVDLGFLLITFFIYTSTIAEQKATDLYLPKEGPPMAVKASQSITLLLSDKVYGYAGLWKDVMASKQIVTGNHPQKQPFLNLIRDRQLALGKDRDKLMVSIKPSENSTYEQVVDAMDLMLLAAVSRYAFKEISEPESQYIGTRQRLPDHSRK